MYINKYILAYTEGAIVHVYMHFLDMNDSILVGDNSVMLLG